MAERHRLRDLQVGEAGHDRLGMLVRRRRPARAAARGHSSIASSQALRTHSGSRSRPGRCASAPCAAAPQPGRSARSSRCSTVMWMSSSSTRSGTPSRSNSSAIWSRPFRIALGILGRNDALVAEHRGMRLRGRDILAPQPLVEADRRVDPRHQVRRGAAKTAAPGLLAGRLVGHVRGVATRAGGGQTASLILVIAPSWESCYGLRCRDSDAFDEPVSARPIGPRLGAGPAGRHPAVGSAQ